ncbi:MAG: hypothetical protein JJE30_14695 [Desulfuromonadales bacterium]|nr:hypothetical protein [Desulfuromonadales bacterium]
MEELQRLQNEVVRINQARTGLLNGMNQAAEKLAVMEKQQFPEMLAKVALGEASDEALDSFRAELRILREKTGEPIQAAIRIIESRLQPLYDQITQINREQAATEHNNSYQAARALIIAKGCYTVHEWDELEHLASNAGDQKDLRLLKQALDDHYRDTQGLRPGYPPFQFV